MGRVQSQVQIYRISSGKTCKCVWKYRFPLCLVLGHFHRSLPYTETLLQDKVMQKLRVKHRWHAIGQANGEMENAKQKGRGYAV